jgi:glycosyltransferase involved in cell wall biosynthesis
MDSGKKLRLCVFPNDPIKSYFDKGEIKPRYFNPMNIFDEIHVVSTVDNDIEESKVKEIAGTGKLFIHTVGKINLKNYKTLKDKVVMLVREIKPDLIRAYNPLIQGWLAAKCSEELNIPLVVSLHINYDKDLRSLSLSNRGILHFLKLCYTLKNIEPHVLKIADRVICVHKSVTTYAKRLGAKKVDVIYNRVYLDQFSPNAEKALKFDKPVIIFVARLTKTKNQECLIKAIKNLDVILLLIGDGPEYEHLKKLAYSLGCEEKVKFIKSVPNSEIHKYYASANIFAAPVRDRGIGISFLEAMATGLPVVIRLIPDEQEELEKAAMMVDNTPEAFAAAFKEIISKEDLREKLKEKSLAMARNLNGHMMEEKESQLYMEVLKNSHPEKI